ncbi:hypothetical protein [Lactococcus lactis]|uniref:SMODS and SLOG-associating 2TM effector domain-containing protein n=1 Tax=Lactococcus lactis TaxID=1358 RepID=A0AAW8UEW3_9LACT|nr:hypothetical protein [Lactococcus lactis]MDT2879880.1 hypothetical protein [Lactococcus lactis]MDT2886577.1 hypothetical protein [Lactococcus lactis]MDT2928658.1 hypothetical protein [Lactococcus lactis]MDT2944629.1 hypothetical protein [Lactococcus lactis]
MKQEEKTDSEIISQSDYVPKKWDKFKSFINDGVIYLAIILILILLNIWQFLCHGNPSEFLKTVFFNKSGEFQWLGVTAIIAACSFLGTSLISLQNRKVDLVSKSRIKWINDTKKLTALYLKDAIRLKNGTQNEKEKKEALDRFRETRELLLLNYSDNEDNKQIRRCIKDCNKYIIKWRKLKSQVKSGQMKKSDLPKSPVNVISNLRMVSTDYFKREWDKAKKGK